jgi:hypothetical protein
MKRWQLAMLLLIFAMVVAVASWYGWSKHAKKMREAGYESNLHSFTAVLSSGMTRNEVEEYLQTRHVEFRRTPWGSSNTVYTDMTRIGQEPAPWYCSRQNVYIAFQFASGTNGSVSADSSDSLTKITIFPMLEDCL